MMLTTSRPIPLTQIRPYLVAVCVSFLTIFHTIFPISLCYYHFLASLRMNSVSLYTQQQKQRLQAIRNATERERLLLEQSKGDDLRQDQEIVHNISPQKWNDVHREVLVATTLGEAGNLEREDLHNRSEQLTERYRDLRFQEQELCAQEGEVDKRLSRAEERKRELLSKLTALQFMDTELSDREGQLSTKEEALNTKKDELRHRQRELAHLMAALQKEESQRENSFNSAAKKLSDKQTENQQILARLRQQLVETEDRAMNIEVQLSTRSRTVDDTEREVTREEMRQRDSEITMIEQLRREVEHRQSVTGLFDRQ